MKNPKISIVTPSFNQSAFLEQTIQSVLGQNYPNLEYIIIDGGSTDDSLEIIRKYEYSLAYWISEPDEGQSDAINKGFNKSTGDIMAWINSDDYYLPGVFEKIVKILESGKPDLVYGGCIHIKKHTGESYGEIPPTFDKELLTRLDYIVQPSTFWTRKLWKRTGPLERKYSFGMDWDWFIRASKFADFKPLPEFFSVYRIHEGHKTGSGDEKRVQEVLELVGKYATSYWRGLYNNFAPTGKRYYRRRGKIRRWHLGRFWWLIRKIVGGKLSMYKEKDVDTVARMFRIEI